MTQHFFNCRILLEDIRKDILLNASQAERQSTEHKSYLKKTAEARKQIIHYETKYGVKITIT